MGHHCGLCAFDLPTDIFKSPAVNGVFILVFAFAFWKILVSVSLQKPDYLLDIYYFVLFLIGHFLS